MKQREDHPGLIVFGSDLGSLEEGKQRGGRSVVVGPNEGSFDGLDRAHSGRV